MNDRGKIPKILFLELVILSSILIGNFISNEFSNHFVLGQLEDIFEDKAFSLEHDRNYLEVQEFQDRDDDKKKNNNLYCNFDDEIRDNIDYDYDYDENKIDIEIPFIDKLEKCNCDLEISTFDHDYDEIKINDNVKENGEIEIEFDPYSENTYEIYYEIEYQCDEKKPDPGNDKIGCDRGEKYVNGKCVPICDRGEKYVNGKCVPICKPPKSYYDQRTRSCEYPAVP